MRLAGWKTYIVAALIAGVAAAQYLGYLDEKTATTITTFLTGAGFAALRAGVAKSG